MKKHMSWLSASFVLLVLIAIVFYVSGRKSSEVTYVSEQERRAGPCPGKEVVYESEAKKYKLFTNWYACHEVARGDLVLLRFSAKMAAVERRVYAIPKDSFKLEIDKEHLAWMIEINQKPALDANKNTLFFGTKNPPLLSLYEKQFDGQLKSGNYIVFNEKSPGDRDSGSLGVVNSEDFLGKVEEGH